MKGMIYMKKSTKIILTVAIVVLIIIIISVIYFFKSDYKIIRGPRKCNDTNYSGWTSFNI